MSEDHLGAFKIEPLKAKNWVAYKRRITAVLRELDLLDYVMGSKKDRPAWDVKDRKVQTRFELTISDGKLVHMTGAKMAVQMWTHLCAVKEARGIKGILATRRRLYKTKAEEAS
ncbi:hypothetical protein BT69DRAFT_1218584 [Atractiella rhizophila]|nr:hypothetical protein BT69DRAFT_1218584 [Atractiella rhizophila]